MATSTLVQEGLSVSDDAYLVSASREGDQEAFNQLVLRYQDRIFNLAGRITGDEHEAADITQITFITAYLNLPRFRNGSFRSWLYRIATNACYDVHRLHHRHPVLSIENKELAEEKLMPLDASYTSSGLPEKEFERHEMERIIQHALVQLDFGQRTLVILVDQQELDYKEAARIMGLPVGTVKSRLARARLRLRQLLNSSLDSLQAA